MARESKDLADYLAVALEDLRFIEEAAKSGSLAADQMEAAAKTFTNAATKLRREAAKAAPKQ